MLIFSIILFVIALGVFIWAIWLGYKFWKDYERSPTLIITEDKIEYDVKQAQVKKGKILITSGRYDIEIKERTKKGNSKDGG